MTNYSETERQDLIRRRKELIIIVCLIILGFLLSYFGMKSFDLGLNLPISNSILIFALININVILLLTLLFLIMRNLVKLFFERKKRIMGARLRTKLVIAFITLSLLPTSILFFLSVQFISNSIEYWYNLPIERSLKNSLEVGQDYLNQVSEELVSFGSNINRWITYQGYTLIARNEELEKYINEKRIEYNLSLIEIFSSKLESRVISKDENIDLSPFKAPDESMLKESFEKGTDIKDIEQSKHGNLIRVILPVFSQTESKAVVNLIVLGKFIPGIIVNRLDGVSRGLEEYTQFKMLKTPIKASHMITLSIVTLLIIFASVWFGFFLSKGITVPIQELAEGTERITAGNYDFFIDLEASDEIGVLVNSFNRMTLDLKNSKKQIEETNVELIKSNIEIERRRLYMEIVLANVAAGVISTDMSGNILTINKSAKDMLNIGAENTVGKNYKKIMSKDQVNIITGFFENKSLLRKGYMRKQVNLSMGNKNLTLLVSINMLKDDHGKYSGLVAVFEDLSEIEQAQRTAAWREVARRIAHEVKNPLTPIQLSAQRIKKKYGQKIGKEDREVFEECTDMIVNQAETLKRLVNEFSSYARMPTSNPVPDDINGIIREAVSLFQETPNGVRVVFEDSEEMPTLKVDREQMKRVMINLLDNAIAAVDTDGEVNIALHYDSELEVVKIYVTDNGKGISPDHKMRLFEPYFSTKKHGTGLGLAIVNTIIRDHNGYIDVQDNMPHGTRFIIELPVSV